MMQFRVRFHDHPRWVILPYDPIHPLAQKPSDVGVFVESLDPESLICVSGSSNIHKPVDCRPE
jgi:hypothetical protein